MLTSGAPDDFRFFTASIACYSGTMNGISAAKVLFHSQPLDYTTSPSTTLGPEVRVFHLLQRRPSGIERALFCGDRQEFLSNCWPSRGSSRIHYILQEHILKRCYFLSLLIGFLLYAMADEPYLILLKLAPLLP